MTIAQGSRVQLHYSLTVDGDLVDSSSGGDAFEFVVGEGNVIRGLEEAVIGMAAGDKGDIVVSPDKGYGEHDAEAVQQFPMAAFENTGTLEVGQMVEGRSQDGEVFQAKVTEVSVEAVTLDFNHPLAGKTLSFAVEIVGVN